MDVPSARVALAGLLGSVVLGGLVGGVLAVFGDHAWYTFQGDRQLDGGWVYQPDHVVSDAQLGQIDLEHVHSVLVPAWSEALQGGRGEGEREQLLGALEPDPNLADLILEMDDLVRRDPVRNADQLLYLTWAWSTYLDRREQPWRLAGAVHVGEASTFQLRSYRVVADVDVDVGAIPRRTRLVERVDHTQVMESFLGVSSRREEGAVVVVDRVVDVVVDRVWPLLDGTSVEYLSDTQRAFAPAIRAAAVDSLPPVELDVLRRTARDRQILVRAVDGIRERTACSRLAMGQVPWNGLGSDDLKRIRRYAAADRGTSCPSATDHEVMALELTTRQLREEPDLGAAVESLTAWVSRAVAVHEARHAADSDGLTCTGCPPHLGADGAAELSAYLAAFAHPALGTLALYQACAQDLRLSGAHGRALGTAFDNLLDEGCEGGPPVDLADRAAALERQWFGRSDPIEMPERWPSRLPID